MAKSEDIYHDYTTIVVGLALEYTNINWRLACSATYTDFQSWESDMDHGFTRCRTLDRTFGGHIEYVLAYRRVDETVASWWHEEKSVKGITGGTSSWEDFKQFLCTRFLEKSTELCRHSGNQGTTGRPVRAHNILQKISLRTRLSKPGETRQGKTLGEGSLLKRTSSQRLGEVSGLGYRAGG